MFHYLPAVAIAILVVGPLGLAPRCLSGQSAIDYLYQGKLQEGELEIRRKLEAAPNDVERFGLGIIQFGIGLEHLIQDLHRHGFLTERTFGPVLPERFRQSFPDHPDPEPFDNEAYRKMLETWVADVTRAEATLARIKADDVKFRLKPAGIKIDLTGNGVPVGAGDLLRVLFGVDGTPPAAQNQPETVRDSQPMSPEIGEFELALDRGDVHWLRGYLHLQAAMGEALLSLDCGKLIEIGAHRVFEKVDTPHRWLLDESRKIPVMSNNDEIVGFLVDMVAIASMTLDVPVTEPERMVKALDHLQATVENGQQMWTFILAETDDDHEWIPNPRQTGSLGIPVNQEMIDTWRTTLKEAERVLRGQQLVPFWRDFLGPNQRAVRGIDVRAVVQNPPERLRILLWIQGTEATAYLREGEITMFADRDFLNRLRRVYGANLFGFAAWFN